MPDPGLVVAIDVGTTGVKAAAVDAAAVSHAAAAREDPTQSPQPGWAVQDPDVVVGMSATAVPFWRQLLADVLGTTIGFPASEQGSALGAARFYRRLLPAFAATANAVQDLNAWRFDEAPDDATLVATGQAGKEDVS